MQEVSRAIDCYLAGRAGCAFASYLLATEMGFPEAAYDLAFLLRTKWVGEKPFAPLAFPRPIEDAPWGRAAPPPQSYLVFRYPDTVATTMVPWNDTARLTAHFQLRAFKVSMRRTVAPLARHVIGC